MHLDREYETATTSATEQELEAYARLVFDRESHLFESLPPSGSSEVARETIAMFPRYSNSVVSLPGPEQAKIRKIADRMLQVSAQRALNVRLVGHADNDPLRERREPGYMQKISVDRAKAVRRALLRLLKGKTALSRIKWDVTGMANRQLLVPNPTSEPARERNRRVDVTVFSQPADPLVSCADDQDKQVDLGKAAAVFFMRTILKRNAVPQTIHCWEPRHTMPYSCDIPFSDNMVIGLEVGPDRIHVFVSEADAEKNLIGKGCWLTYQCLRSGRFKFFAGECTL